jgi:nitroreductase/FMN reductase [NAD(P)H]
MSASQSGKAIADALQHRFGESFAVDETLPGLDELARLAARRVHRRYTADAVDPKVLRLLCACALSAPSKSDLQQADIVILDKPEQGVIADLIPDQPFIRTAPAFLVFLANGRRLAEVSKMRGKPFPNDHLDQFFNAACDAAIIMATFICAAEAAGLGCCPISHVRNDAQRVSEILELPDWVVPFAGLCVGYPERGNRITPRLPLAVTVHKDRYEETQLANLVESYDRRRHALQPYAKQRDAARFGAAPFYGWSEDKARQYAVRERDNFGAFVRRKRFGLD